MMLPSMKTGRRWLTLLLPLASAAVFAVAAGRSAPVAARLRHGAPSEADRKAILETLRLFNRVYQDFYASAGGAAMIDVFPASTDVKHHVFRDLGFLRDAQLVLVHDLAELTPVEVRETGADSAEAVLFEEGNYLYQHPDRSPAMNEKGLGQGFRYRLRREHGRWIVTHWEYADVTPPSRGEGPTR